MLFLFSVERLEEQAVAIANIRRDLPADVASGSGVLNLDHLGPKVSEV